MTRLMWFNREILLFTMKFSNAGYDRLHRENMSPPLYVVVVDVALYLVNMTTSGAKGLTTSYTNPHVLSVLL